MSRCAIAILSLLLAQCSGPSAGANGSGQIPQDGTSWVQAHVTPGQDMIVASTGAPLRLSVDGGDDVQTISLLQPPSPSTIKIVAPATIGLHPTLKYFYVNEGMGSGQFSILRLYEVSESQMFSTDLSKIIKDRFLAVTKCQIDPNMISISAQGWDAKRADVLVIIESLDRQTYCNRDMAIAMDVDVPAREIKNVFTKSSFRYQFCRQKSVKEQIGICAS
jgi:hypothetical protein